MIRRNSSGAAVFRELCGGADCFLGVGTFLQAVCARQQVSMKIDVRDRRIRGVLRITHSVLALADACHM